MGWCVAEERFTTIAQHWAHFLERDIPPNAPDVQVMAMKQAFAAGAISGLQLAVETMKSPTPRADIEAHIEGIKTLGGVRG
jgi:hypothetical protein